VYHTDACIAIVAVLLGGVMDRQYCARAAWPNERHSVALKTDRMLPGE